MYYRRYSGVVSRGTAPQRDNPRSGEELRSQGSSLSKFAGCSWPPLQFRLINFAEEPLLIFSFYRSSTRTHDKKSLGHDRRRPSLILSSSYNWLNRESAHWPRSCYKDLNEMSDAGRCDPFILHSRPFLYAYRLYSLCTLSISAVDPRQARCFVRTVVFITRENNVRGIGDRPEKSPRSTTTSWMDERPTSREIAVWILDTIMNLERARTFALNTFLNPTRFLSGSFV